MKIHKTLLLKIVEPNEGKRKKLENTIELYAKVLKFYLEVIPRLGMYRIASMSNKEALTFLELNTVPTKAHPSPPFPIFGGVQTNIRRSAINRAVGMVNIFPISLDGTGRGKSSSTQNPLIRTLRAFPSLTTGLTLSLRTFCLLRSLPL